MRLLIAAALLMTGCVSLDEIKRRQHEEYLASPHYKCEQMGGIPYNRKTEYGSTYYGGCDFPGKAKR